MGRPGPDLPLSKSSEPRTGIVAGRRTPGPQTVAAGDLGFSSLDNDDPTSRQVRRALSPSTTRRSAYGAMSSSGR
ncbi:hypothetical protein NOCARDAX2BIS_190013 [Nocardioides sp. AX2bis]|nr:hypothetical protein NOCARDAX2BIS_190013 [Nocardioides sp. AX2bis]